MTVGVSGLEDLPRAAQALLAPVSKANVVALHGEMGAGKTTLIKALGEALGVKETVNSPTFSLVNEYCDGEGNPVYHFDFYRLERIEEAYDMGYEEYFYSGNLCLVEWPEKVLILLPPDTLHLYIEVAGKNKRLIHY